MCTTAVGFEALGKQRANDLGSVGVWGGLGSWELGVGNGKVGVSRQENIPPVLQEEVREGEGQYAKLVNLLGSLLQTKDGLVNQARGLECKDVKRQLSSANGCEKDGESGRGERSTEWLWEMQRAFSVEVTLRLGKVKRPGRREVKATKATKETKETKATHDLISSRLLVLMPTLDSFSSRPVTRPRHIP